MVEPRSLAERKLEGVFYTSPEVVKFMARLALANYLGNFLNPPGSCLNQLGTWNDPPGSIIAELVHANKVDGMNTEDRESLLQLLKTVKILDPAVGEGAFLCGIMDELLRLRCLLGEKQHREQIVRNILTANLYGVDRDAKAVNFCRRRSLSNIVCGDSLMDLPAGWGQFDIVLANPPYVRQEFLDKSYKQQLVQRFRQQGINLKERSDLYVYFFARFRELLKAGGTAVVISASSWLDVDYGSPLQRHLLNNYRLHLIMESACERWFKEAGINTNIVLLEKENPAGELAGAEQKAEQLIRFVQLKRKLQEYEESSIGSLIGNIFSAADRQDNSELRIYPVSRQELLNSGIAGKLTGVPKWGKYLRAPEVFLRILERGREKLSTLGELAEVRFGVKTGCNKFFYLRGSQLAEVESEYLIPVVKSPREVPGVKVEQDRLKYKLLTVNQKQGALQGKQVLEYILRGEESGYHLRPSVRGRDLWYCVETNKGKGLLFRRFFHDKFNIPLVAGDIAEDQTFYRVVYPGEVELLGAIVNSTITALFIELSGRLALGEGVLQFAVYEAAQVLVTNPESISPGSREKLRGAFNRISGRDTGTIFTEVQEPDRRELDLAVLEILGFRGMEAMTVLEEVYRAMTDLVRQRLVRAQNHLTEVAVVD